MDKKIRQAQYKVLEAFSQEKSGFALSGGTALELYYLHHRFSVDLDFFSPECDLKEIDRLTLVFSKFLKARVKLDSEFLSSNRAKVRFYTADIPGSDRPLKIDFVEDVIFDVLPAKRFNGVQVYGIENIYMQKICAITGTTLKPDEIGRETTQGRNEARDVFDMYMLSKKIKPLHLYLKKIPAAQQRGLIHWYRSFSRQDLKLSLLELDIYDKNFDAREMINYLEGQIKEFAKEVMG